MRQNTIRFSVGLGLFSLLILSMQNCSQPGSIVLKDTQSLSSDAGGSSGASDPTESASPVPSASASPSPSGSPSSDCSVTHTCPATDIAEFSCRKFVALAAADEIEIPARDTDGTCYTLKLFSAVASSKSTLTTVFDDDVLSRNHDTTSSNPNDTRHPYVLGKKTINFKMHDQRNVQLSGASSNLSSIKIDNFVMTAIYPRSLPVAAGFFKAYGSSDSTVYGTNGVQFRGAGVPLKAFESGGTSSIGTLDITDYVEVEKSYSLDVRALDCGGIREMTDVYVLFR